MGQQWRNLCTFHDSMIYVGSAMVKIIEITPALARFPLPLWSSALPCCTLAPCIVHSPFSRSALEKYVLVTEVGLSVEVLQPFLGSRVSSVFEQQPAVATSSKQQQQQQAKSLFWDTMPQNRHPRSSKWPPIAWPIWCPNLTVFSLFSGHKGATTCQKKAMMPRIPKKYAKVNVVW